MTSSLISSPPTIRRTPAKFPSWLFRNWSVSPGLLVAAGAFLVSIAGMYFLCTQKTEGVFVYLLDDAYIHLALARNLAHHGVWGLQPQEFSSVASSLTWPVQLAFLMRIFGPVEWFPLALNLVYGIVALCLAHRILSAGGVPERVIFWILIFQILITSLPLLALQGMEHNMHIALATLFVFWASRYLTQSSSTRTFPFSLYILAALMTATRYEGVFLVLAVWLVSTFKRRWVDVLLLPLFAALPLVSFGCFSLSQGGHWLPNPIIVKSGFRTLQSLQDFVMYITTAQLLQFQVMAAVTFPLLLALVGVLYDTCTRKQLSSEKLTFVFLVVLTGVFHLLGARVGWYIRYEAYLVFLGILANALAWQPNWADLRQRMGALKGERAALAGCCVLLLALIASAPFVYRLAAGLFAAPTASKNVYDQQMQLARFVKEYYPDQALILNDVGAVTWYTEAQPVDMAGLTTYQVAQAINDKYFTSHWLTKLAHQRQARIAVVYNTKEWLPPPRPPVGWIHVGSWTISQNIICDKETIHFYALDAEAAEDLSANLQAFSDRLPVDVIYNTFPSKNNQDT